MHWVIDEMVAEDDKVCTRLTWTGTHEGPFFGIPATGRGIAVKGVVIDRLVAGRMADSRILMDTLSMMQQLGILPAPSANASH
jgi:predicted ester cyclase